jgi:hypothetical protein
LQSPLWPVGPVLSPVSIPPNDDYSDNDDNDDNGDDDDDDNDNNDDDNVSSALYCIVPCGLLALFFHP